MAGEDIPKATIDYVSHVILGHYIYLFFLRLGFLTKRSFFSNFVKLSEMHIVVFSSVERAVDVDRGGASFDLALPNFSVKRKMATGP